MNYNNLLINIKSLFVLKRIFRHLQENLFLNTIKYNKKLQKLLDLGVKDYKEYSFIEIELFPCENKSGTFITIKKEQASFFHIFLNDNKEETNKTYFS